MIACAAICKQDINAMIRVCEPETAASAEAAAAFMTRGLTGAPIPQCISG